MPETLRKTPNYARRIIWLGVFVVLLVVGYSAGWLYLARLIESRTDTALAAMEKKGITARCTNPEARGYPFRIGLFCDGVSFEDAAQGARARAGAFRSAGQIYDPLRLVAELDSPASIDAPRLGQVELSWRTLRASVRLAEPLPTRISLEGAAFDAVSADGKPLVTADTFEGHVRPNDKDIDLAFRFGGLALDPALANGRVLPPLSGEGDITIADGVRLVIEKDETLRGRSGTIRALAISLGGEGTISLSGPVAIGGDGLINADLKLGLREPKALEQALATAFPEAARQIRQGFSGLAILGNQPSLPLRIVGGKASLGFIPLGNIPPVK
jgi:hypothetical protein